MIRFMRKTWFFYNTTDKATVEQTLEKHINRRWNKHYKKKTKTKNNCQELLDHVDKGRGWAKRDNNNNNDHNKQTNKQDKGDLEEQKFSIMFVPGAVVAN